MTVYLWQAYAGSILEAEGSRTDHKGSPEALAVEVGADLRVAGVPVTAVSVRAAQLTGTGGYVDSVCEDSEGGTPQTLEAVMAVHLHLLSTPLQHGPPS